MASSKFKLSASAAEFNPGSQASPSQRPPSQAPPSQRPPSQYNQAAPSQALIGQDRYGNQVKISQDISPQQYDWPGRSSFMRPLVEESTHIPPVSSVSKTIINIPCRFGKFCNRGENCQYDHSMAPKKSKDFDNNITYSKDCNIAINISYSPEVDAEDNDGNYVGNYGSYVINAHVDNCLKCKFEIGDMTRKEILELAHMLVVKYYKPNTFKSSCVLLELLIEEKPAIAKLIETSFNSGNVLILPPSSFKPIKEQIQSDGKRTVWISRPGYPALINYEEVFIEDHINLDKLSKCKDGKDCMKMRNIAITGEYSNGCSDIHDYDELLRIFREKFGERLQELEESIELYYFNLVRASKSVKYALDLKGKDVKYKTYCNPGAYALVIILKTFIESEIPRKDRDIWPSERIIIPDYADLYNSTKLYEQTQFEYVNIMEIVKSYDNKKVVDALSAIFENLKNPTFKILAGKKLKNILNYSYLMDVFALSIEQLSDVFEELFVDGEYDKTAEVFSAVVTDETDETKPTIAGFEEIAENLVQYLLNGVWENEEDEDDRFDPEDSEDSEDSDNNIFNPDYLE